MNSRLLLTALLALALASAAAMAARPVERLPGCAAPAPIHTAFEIAPVESMAFLRARHRGAVP